MKGNLRAERIRNSDVHFFVCLVETLVLLAHLQQIFFRNYEPNPVPDMNLSYLQSMSIYYPSRKYKLSMRFFLESPCPIVFVPLVCLQIDGCC